jgi:hypothetical protein
MANDNTVASIYGLSAQTINASTETALTQTVNGTASPFLLSVPANWNIDGKSFRVRLVGRATGGTSATLILKIYLGTVAAGTNIAAFTVSGAAIPTPTLGGSNFSVETTLTYDSTSQTVNGTHGGQTANTITAIAANTQGTSITSVAGLTFSASATFGAAVATNTITVSEFAIEQV